MNFAIRYARGIRTSKSWTFTIPRIGGKPVSVRILCGVAKSAKGVDTLVRHTGLKFALINLSHHPPRPNTGSLGIPAKTASGPAAKTAAIPLKTARV